MKTKKVKGTNIVEKLVKPIPEPVTIYEISFKTVIEYLSSLEPLATQILWNYWEKEQVFEDYPEVLYLPLPDENSELVLITRFVLDQYPDWNKTQFLMEY